MSDPRKPEPPDPGKTLIESSQAAEAARELSAPKDAVQHPDAPVLRGYFLTQPIGRGAFAEVWRGWQERTRKWVAVKVFKQTTGLNWMLLQREVERLVKLDKHPYIVSLLDADLAGQTPYYVLDLIEAGSLERMVVAPSLESVRKTAVLMEEVAEALSYVHAKGIIHCDLKPANILMDDQGRPRVADFGQSRVLNDSSAALGTLFYMAPEQAMPASSAERAFPDVRWDVYALGATFYSLLTGKTPHAATIRSGLDATGGMEERLKAYREAVFAGGVPRIDEPAVDEDLAAIVEKCLEPRAPARYASMAEVLRDLKARRELMPVTPLAHDRKYRARKFLKRNSVLAAVSAAALIALSVAGVRLVQESSNLRRQLAVSYLAQSQLEFWKGNPLRAVTYGAHSNTLNPSHLARTSTLRYLSEIATPLMVYPAEGPTAFSPDGKLCAATDYRFGFEVRDTRTGRLIAGPIPTKGYILTLTFSPDGKTVATSTRDKEIRLWDSATGKPRGDALPEQGVAQALAFSPDGRELAVGSSDGGVRFWNAATGRPQGALMKHADRVTAILFSPDGKTLLSASEYDFTARLWKMPGGEPLAVMRQTNRVHGIAFSPNGKLVATAGGDKTARLWDARTGAQVGKSMLHDSHVLVAAFSPDGRRLITGGWDTFARIWDVATQRPIGKPMKSGADVVAAAFSPDGRLVVTGSADTTAQVWDASTQEPYGFILEHPTALRGAAFMPDGRGVLTLTVGGSARLWAVAPAPVLDRVLEHGQGVWDAAFSPDGRFVATGGKDGTAKIWDASTGKFLNTLPHGDRVPSIAFSPDSSKLLTGSLDGHVRLWEAASGKIVADAVSGKDVMTVEYGADGKTVLSAGKNGDVRLWDPDGLKPKSFTIWHTGALKAAHLSPDGRWVLTAGKDGTARLWDAATGKASGQPMTHVDSIDCAVFSPDGTLVLTGSADYTARLWRVPGGEPVPGILLYDKDGIKTAAFSPDGRSMLTGGHDQRMRLWDVHTGQLMAPLMSHAGDIESVAFSPDGKTLLSGGVEHLARLWDAETGIAIRTFQHKDAVLVAKFSPDGRRVLTASTDGTARIWETPWLTQEISPGELKRRADRATMKEIDAQGSVVTISQPEWEDAFLNHPDR